MSILTPVKVIPEARAITSKPRRSDQVFRIIVTTGGMASLVILGLIALFLSLPPYAALSVHEFVFGLYSIRSDSKPPLFPKQTKPLSSSEKALAEPLSYAGKEAIACQLFAPGS